LFRKIIKYNQWYGGFALGKYFGTVIFQATIVSLANWLDTHTSNINLRSTRYLIATY